MGSQKHLWLDIKLHSQQNSNPLTGTEMWIWFSFQRKWALVISYIFGQFLLETLYCKVQNKVEKEEYEYKLGVWKKLM